MKPIDAYKLCANLAAPRGSARHYSLLFLEKNKRNALSALYAFQLEVMAIHEQCSERQVALAKLNWWRSEINAVFDGKPTHPIAQALQDSINLFSLHPQRFHNILNAIESDICTENYTTESELTEFFSRCGGEVEIIAACILSYSHPETLTYARHLGIALQAFDNILNLHSNLNAGLIYFSEEKLLSHKVSHAELAKLTLTDGLHDLIAEQLQFVEQHFTLALNTLAKIDRETQYPGLIMIDIQQELIAAIKSENYDVLSQRIYLTLLRMLWKAVKIHWSI